MPRDYEQSVKGFIKHDFMEMKTEGEGITMEEKKIKPYRGKSLDEWVELNKLSTLREHIETHCNSVLEDYDADRSHEDAMLLTRLILTSLRDWYS